VNLFCPGTYEPITQQNSKERKKTMFGVSPLSPSYGRDYKNKKDLLADWEANKDFITASGQYTSRSELKQIHPHLKTINIRYKQNRCVLVAKL